MKSILKYYFLSFGVLLTGCQSADDKAISRQQKELEQLFLSDDGPIKYQKVRAEKTAIYDENVPYHEQANRVLVAGDSWAYLTCTFGSVDRALSAAGSKLAADPTCLSTSLIGMEARDWLRSKQHKNLLRALRFETKIKVIYLSLGGNDLIAQWNKEDDDAKILEISKGIAKNVELAAKEYLNLRPDIRIVVTGYDYPFFRTETKNPFFKKLFNQMKQPTTEQINHGLEVFNRTMVEIQNGRNIFYIHHMGLAHYYDGVCSKGVPARTTRHPADISSLSQPLNTGGINTEPACLSSYLFWPFLGRDSFHMTPRLYYQMAKHSYDNVISNFENFIQ